jgi:glutamate-1-semialdehyde 2,1-aminomutase
MAERYNNSERQLARALRTIPLGSQTFSKSKTQYPYGVSPFFLSKGMGSHVWDVDGNEYIDFVNGLAAITLGYNDTDVNGAVEAQLHDGVIFSLPHPLEAEVAEKIVTMVPCAEMVRFAKNGSDATAGAIRLARAYTGRDHVAVCGYHGWQDWYIGSTTRNLGVPKSTQELTHPFPYNNLGALAELFDSLPGKVAAVILEPMNTEEPHEGFLQQILELTHARGALLIFDETITGFRFSNGGAQGLFGVTPDLATLGKGIANGFPLSAVVGRSDVMRLMEEIFFSSTFGGETLSLAAGLATLGKLERVPVTETLRVQGQKVLDGLKELIGRHQVGHFLAAGGHPSWSFLLLHDLPPEMLWGVKTLLLQELFARGILSLGTHNMSYSHSDADIGQLLHGYDEIVPLLRQVVEGRRLEDFLRCEPLKPLFKIR